MLCPRAFYMLVGLFLDRFAHTEPSSSVPDHDLQAFQAVIFCLASCTANQFKGGLASLTCLSATAPPLARILGSSS